MPTTESAMSHALTQFRHQMSTANRHFLLDRVHEIQSLHLPTEAANLHHMRRYWPSLGRGGQETYWNRTVAPEPVREDREVRSVTRLADVPGLYHQYMDGVCPPRLRTEEWRRMYLAVVAEVCAEVVAEDGQDGEDGIPPCEELGLFLKYANGVQDPDFRRSGIAPFLPGFFVGVAEYAFPDEAAGQGGSARMEIEGQRGLLKGYLEESLLGRVGLHGMIDEDLEVKVGFLTGTGGWGHEDRWYSAYTYCRRREDDAADTHQTDFAWRVLFFEASDDDTPATLNGRRPLFDSIPEFLDWYGSWFDYIDMDEVRREIDELNA
ncbi:uncharacterized protein BP01DRAFT_358955 [Aspergillus saccharolyticus JOP 1030-1]|uniref:Uncharacterized protein n=1 Tax=Aspergillus saccharolyticus JOP 1030-1 TaxID=1450539 RepID=A0A318ZH10_9EURO|nr:hypothetical protein BP01DRAFT_358955 [Aspergillus saccharolyticus JOP 1030-1]PYH42960.1 hypothetical protein BP01DRAFT_358955 [Aspergillus saccharolyticus JOP 1030-1]